MLPHLRAGKCNSGWLSCAGELESDISTVWGDSHTCQCHQCQPTSITTIISYLTSPSHSCRPMSGQKYPQKWSSHDKTLSYDRVGCKGRAWAVISWSVQSFYRLTVEGANDSSEDQDGFSGLQWGNGGYFCHWYWYTVLEQILVHIEISHILWNCSNNSYM